MTTQKTLHDLKQQATLTQDQLNALIELHARFLCGRLGGRRAILQNMNISGLSLAKKDMRQLDFSGCSMMDMDLSGTNFRDCLLYTSPSPRDRG